MPIEKDQSASLTFSQYGDKYIVKKWNSDISSAEFVNMCRAVGMAAGYDQDFINEAMPYQHEDS